jgi:8-oxo-dGTP pyrophosphatase MutT (NUDIX family)
MHREPLLKLLARYRAHGPITPEERAPLERLEAFVRREPACFARSTVEGHITGSAWILDHARAACLLTHHRKLGLWLQPGGHADGDPDVLAVALREGREESGIAGLAPLSPEIFDVDVHEIPARKGEPAHLHYDVRFALVAPEGARFVVSEESHALAWVPRAEVSTYNTDASVLRMAAKWDSPT